MKNKDQNVHILVIEDSFTQAMKLQYLLENNGYQTSVAHTGTMAIGLLNAADSKLPNIIISDVVMPEMDGYELCKIIKSDKRLKDIPILLLTNLSEPDDIIKGLECNADHFITKPYDEQFLLSRLHYVLINERIRTQTSSNMGIQIYFSGKKHMINSNRIQILDLLLSTYENVLHKKKELENANRELQSAIFTIEKMESEYRSVFQKTADAIFIVSRDSRILFTNPAGESLFEKTIKEIIGNNFEFPIREGLPTICHKTLESGRKIMLEIISESIEWQEHDTWLVTARDITTFEKMRNHLQASVGNLKETINGTMQAIGKIIENKTPFAQGRSQRVAELACRIADELNLPEEKISGLRLAAHIHNIGYVQLPDEILNKSGKLNQEELEIIRSHTKIAYDFFYDTEFPWPIAQILLQHHERWNGSGYPDGISGQNILIEARILAVADVVNAMSSTRPHRQALAQDKTLKHIADSRGILFDPDIVDACLRVFGKEHIK
ncbi:response regulator [Desulfobacterales bacterium HSG17]|nr:response regulator [Desulfobacterales bacterium HSG17]